MKVKNFLPLVLIALGSTGARAQDLGDLTRIKVNESLDKSTVLISVNGIGSGPDGIGTGFVATPEGWIITNYHVVADPQFDNNSIVVKFKDGSAYPGRVIGTDQENDLAIVSINRVHGKQVSYLKFGNSDKVVVGQTVLAKGNPLGLEGTLSQGIVSAIRNIKSPTGGHIKDAIQTDAVIAQGNSGGPLVNALGEVIGVISGGAYNSKSGTLVNNINFAVPIRRAKELIERVKLHGGDDKFAAYNPRNDDISAPTKGNSRRPLSQDVDPSQPDRSSLGRQPVDSTDNEPYQKPPVYTGRSRDPNMQIGAPARSIGRSTGSLSGGGWAYLGITGADYSDGRIRGVRVVDIEPNSPAARAGLRSDREVPPRTIQKRGTFQSTGHIITSVDGRKVETLDDLAELLGDKYPGDSISLTTVCCDGRQEEKFKIRVGWALDTRNRSTNVMRGPNRSSTSSQDFGTGITVRVIGPDGKPMPPRAAPPAQSSSRPDTNRGIQTLNRDPLRRSPSGGRRGPAGRNEPYLGIEGDDFSLNGLKGVKIASVARNSPAEISGLRSDSDPPPRDLLCQPTGHVITAINNETISSTEDLESVLSRKSPGEILDLTVVTCGGKVKEIVPIKLSSR